MGLVNRVTRLGSIKVSDSYDLVIKTGAHARYFTSPSKVSIYQAIK